jgi:hypothetical protein
MYQRTLPCKAVTDFPFNLTLLRQNEIHGLEEFRQKQYEKQTCFFTQVKTATYTTTYQLRAVQGCITTDKLWVTTYIILHFSKQHAA